MSKYLKEVNEVLSKPSRSVAIVNENINENFWINEVVEENQKDKKEVVNESVFQRIYNESKKEKIPTEVLKKKKSDSNKKLSPEKAKIIKKS